jgi:ABC-type glutathione transport system ATPase component
MVHARDDAGACRLAAAGFANQRQRATWPQRQRDAAQRLHKAEAAFDRVERDHRLSEHRGQRVHARASRARAAELLRPVGIPDPQRRLAANPHELSGGQRQRVNIARALAVEPEVLVADEPTSMLDVSIRLGILELLARIKRERQLAMLYITHDIATAAHVAEEVVVMFAGQMVEWGSTDQVIGGPRHLYTQLLLSAVPGPNQRFNPGESTEFLAHAEEVRRRSRPASQVIEQVGPNHFVRSLGEA